jgi:hypothetical protein
MHDKYGYYFELKGKGQMEGPNDPKSTHFRDENAETSLVREMIQNALDARADHHKGPVTVEFELRDYNLSTLPDIEGLTEAATSALREHQGTQGVNKLEIAVRTLTTHQGIGSIPTLRIGDYGTTGLTGNENVFDGKDAHLARLTRADGLSSDDPSRGGSFGIGSSAARIVSDLRTVAYITKPHDKQENVYASLTYLAGWRDKDDKGHRATGIYTKLGIDGENVEYLRGVSALAGFKPRTEDGTDVYVLGASTFAGDLQLKRLLRASVENFFVAIWNERLVVKGFTDGSQWELNKTTLRSHIDMDEQLTKDILPFFRAMTEGELREGKTPALGKVRMHVLVGDDVSAKYGTMVMRKPLMVVRKFRTHVAINYAAIFVGDDDKGNAILREMEPPKHNDWSPKTPDGKSGYQGPYQEVTNFIRDTLLEFVPAYDEEKFVFEGLADLLPIDSQVAPPDQKIRSGGDETGVAQPHETGVELGKPDSLEGRVTPTLTQELEIDQDAVNDPGDEVVESGGGFEGGDGPPPQPGPDGPNPGPESGDKDDQGSVDPQGNAVMRRRDLTFRSFTLGGAKTAVIVTARRDIKGRLPIFAIGSASEEAVDLKSAALIAYDGVTKLLSVDNNLILDLALEKNVPVRLEVEFTRGSRYRLGVGNG